MNRRAAILLPRIQQFKIGAKFKIGAIFTRNLLALPQTSAILWLINAGKRIFSQQNFQAKVWHCFSKIIDRAHVLNVDSKTFMLKTIRAYEDLLDVEVLT